MSSPCIAAVLLAPTDCPNCHSEQEQTVDGRIMYVIDLCDEHAVSKDYFVPLRVTIEIRTRTSLVATVDDSEGCLQRGICPACRERTYLRPKGNELWGVCTHCGAEWPVP